MHIITITKEREFMSLAYIHDSVIFESGSELLNIKLEIEGVTIREW